MNKRKKNKNNFSKKNPKENNFQKETKYGQKLFKKKIPKIKYLNNTSKTVEVKIKMNPMGSKILKMKKPKFQHFPLETQTIPQKLTILIRIAIKIKTTESKNSKIRSIFNSKVKLKMVF